MKSFAASAIIGLTAAAGPGDWGYFNMGKDWTKQCATGKHQSPIDLNLTGDEIRQNNGHGIKIQNFSDQKGLMTHVAGKTGKYANGALYLKRKNAPQAEVGRRLQAKPTYGKVDGALNLDANGDIELQRQEGSFKTLHYQPNQLHVHAPSEHTINGEYYELEMHFVMLPHGATADAHEKFAANQKAKDGDFDYKVNYAVLGVMFRETDCNDAAGKTVNDCEAKLKITQDFFNSMRLDQIPTGSKSPAENKNAYWGNADEVPLKAFMDSLDTSQFFAYEGSLTTPPCWEGVRWTVLRNALPVSKNAMNYIDKLYKKNEKFAGLKGNNRVIMPVNDRYVFYMGASFLATSVTALGLSAAALF